MIFRIITKVWNAEEWIGRCIESVIRQNCENWTMSIVDDNSEDSTWDQILSYAGHHEKIQALRHKHRDGGMKSIIDAVRLSGEGAEDVMVWLDGDDWLYDQDVLDVLCDYYNKGAWVTHGTFLRRSTGQIQLTPDYFDIAQIRKAPWMCSHLKTFKRKLFEKIKDEDLRDPQGQYYTMANDVAVMMPVCEMAGPGRVFHIEKPLYVYNDLTGRCNHHVSRAYQVACEREIRTKTPYKEWR